MEGTQIGSYVIERQLGEGGFGVVYVGRDVRLGRRAAIKQLLPELSGHREIVERFFNEAKAAAGIDHPGIIEIYDVGWHTDGSAYFAMKLLDGDSLAQRLRASGPMSVPIAATIARQVTSALAAAHARGIVHRDLKPDNVMLVPDDEVVIGERAIVLDFGIAKLFGDKPLAHKTRTGMMMGTPAYMSPEQCRGAGEVDHRTDLYAVGCILFEMLAGRPPFVAEGAGEILGMHQFVAPPPLRALRPDIPAELEAVVMRALAKQPEQRMQQMTELTTALQSFATGGASSRQLPAASALRAYAAEPTPSHLLHAAQQVTYAAPAAAPRPSTYSAALGEVVPPKPRHRRPLPIALTCAALAAGGVVLAMVNLSGDPAHPAASPDAAPTVAQSPLDAVVAHQPAPDAPALDAPDAPADAPEATEIMARARKLVDDKQWDAAFAATAELAKLDPSNSHAKAIASIALAEGKHEAAEQDLIAAIDRGDAAVVKAAYAKIPNDSVYKPSARTRHDKFVAAYVAKVRRQGQALAEKRACRELEALGAKAGKLFPAAGATVKEIECTAPTPENPNQLRDRFERLVLEANRAMIESRYDKALALAEVVLATAPSHMDALATAAISACNIKATAKAKRYIGRLSGARQRAARQICLRNRVAID